MRPPNFGGRVVLESVEKRGGLMGLARVAGAEVRQIDPGNIEEQFVPVSEAGRFVQRCAGDEGFTLGTPWYIIQNIRSRVNSEVCPPLSMVVLVLQCFAKKRESRNENRKS